MANQSPATPCQPNDKLDKLAQSPWLHPKLMDQPQLPIARFARLPGDPRIFAMHTSFSGGEEPATVLASSDNGQTWQPTGTFMAPLGMQPTDSGVFIGTRQGSLIAAFSNRAESSKWSWDAKLHDSPDAKLPLYVTRSTDAGKTWNAPILLHEDWTGASRDIIQTSQGSIVFTTTKLLHKPGRHSVLTYNSDDDGVSWAASNILDFGGSGDHDGLCEATLVELRDGRLLKYIRTPWGFFWRAMSSDQGKHWHPYGPTQFDASSAPGFLLRLASGRIALVWNRRLPQDHAPGDKIVLRGGDGTWSSTPSSNYRKELSLAFSNDEGRTWSTPVIIASNTRELAYPTLFEPTPGQLWLCAYRYNLHASFKEADFIS